MTTKSQSIKPIGCLSFVIIAFIIMGVFKCTNGDFGSGKSDTVPTEHKSSFIDASYGSIWRQPMAGDESIGLAKALSQNSIPCGDWQIKESIENSGLYLCACRVDYPDPWKFYQVWSLTGDVLKVDSWKVQYKPSIK